MKHDEMKQEPVACANCDDLSDALGRAIWDRIEVEDLLFKLTGVKWIPKENTSQPKREWVELTPEEIQLQANEELVPKFFAMGAAWANAKLKEKNGG